MCVDDPERLAEAQTLYRDALEYVEASVGALHTEPRAMFCAKPACSREFGFKGQRAYTLGTAGFAISDGAWRPHFVRHELIHHLQNERLGSLRNWLFKPIWFREGMAYSLSADPRHPLPEPLQGYRSRFETWYGQVGPATLWHEAERL